MARQEELKLMENELEYAVKWNDTPNIKKWLYYIERIDDVEDIDDIDNDDDNN